MPNIHSSRRSHTQPLLFPHTTPTPVSWCARLTQMLCGFGVMQLGPHAITKS